MKVLAFGREQGMRRTRLEWWRAGMVCGECAQWTGLSGHPYPGAEEAGEADGKAVVAEV